MFRKDRTRSQRGNGIPESLIPAELADVIYNQRAFEEHCAAMVKLSKKYEDTITELGRERVRLREELLSMPIFTTRQDDSTPERLNFDERIDQFRKVTDFLAERGKDLHDNYHGAVNDPLKRFMKMFPAINEKVKQHERCALDYVKAKERYDRTLHSSQADQAKRDKAASQCDAALNAFNNVNELVPEELPLIHAARFDFLDPSCMTMVAAHIRYLEAVVDNLSAICHEHEVKMSDEDYNREIEDIFSKLSALRITADGLDATVA
ncbi:uncharacterized protein MONBRDRAFT_35478 [Monosiga brevicollis MX1]|uniref:BAR domain-containing protein n=1 Tax=Monosiga brevicollis TaxID=81824 RepID=A9UPC6_MONBE|nr:uncharacterized protein MONBRDRAFT_35478 [Monosiga brevicollis MX1]EDQ92394.1 predicted protein [Monosiga brevicollis MX1]|eukprot:XP_001742156.1 hypothetical protein [Monosiga brevicollis MX1]